MAGRRAARRSPPIFCPRCTADFTNGLCLKLHDDRAVIRPTKRGVTFVGFRIWPTHRFLTKDNIRVFRRRLRWMERECLAGRMSVVEVRTRVQSWCGHAINAHSDRLILAAHRRVAALQDEVKKISGRGLRPQREEG